jgi:tetratricopeptide (TPR) repeat protein
MLNFCGEYEKALVELEHAKRLDPFSNDLVFGPLALCHYWLGNNDEAIEIFKTIKILNWHLFYLAAIYLKTGEKELAKEKLKEAKAVSGTDINQFIDSQPYTKEELATSLRDVLKAIDV